MDPQGHCGVGLAVPEEQIEKTIYDTLIETTDGKPSEISQIVWQIATDFDLAPSNIRLAAFEQVFSQRAGRDERLRKALEKVKASYQWCVIDCPPSVGLLTFNALKAADEVVVPVETGYFSLHGLAKMMETLEVMRQRCGRDVLIRILPTLYDTRTKLAREVLSELRVRFKQYLMESAVNFNTKLKEAASFGQPITEYDPGSRGYKDFVLLARELMGHKIAEAPQVRDEHLSRPAELVQRARQLAQLTNVQFGRAGAASNSPAGAPVYVETSMPPRIVSEPAEVGGGPGDFDQYEQHIGSFGETPKLEVTLASRIEPPVVSRVEPAALSKVEMPRVGKLEPTLVSSVASAGASKFQAPVASKVETPGWSKVEPPVVSKFETPVVSRGEPAVTSNVSPALAARIEPAAPPRWERAPVTNTTTTFAPQPPAMRLTAGTWPLATDLVIPNRFLQSLAVSREGSSMSIPAAQADALSLAPKSTQQKIEEFYGVKQIGTEVLFAARFERAQSVLLAGDFNNWTPQMTPMISGERPGDWRKLLQLSPGRYKYRLVVDGRWVTDPNNTYVEANQFGELDNVIEVGRVASTASAVAA
jgi:chromosome partitioning protein